MTTTVSVSQKGQVELPEGFRKRKKIKPGTALRMTELGDGLYVTPLPEPTEKELREALAAAGSLTRRQTREEEEMVQKCHRRVSPREATEAMNVVADTNVFISAIFWPGESRQSAPGLPPPQASVRVCR